MKRLILLMMLLFQTGCWDKVEIEDRGFVIGVGVDEAEGEPKYLLTQQFVVPPGIGGGSGQAGGSKPGGKDAFMNVKEQGDSMFAIVRAVAAKTSRAPFYGHVKLIIISENIAKGTNVGNILDFYLRDPEMRRGTLVLVSKGKAGDVLDVSPKNEKLPTMFVNSLQENTYKNAEIYPKTRIGDIHEYLLKNQSFPLTMIEKLEKNLELKNTAIINGQDFQMVGKLEREGTMGLNFIRDEIDGGVLEVKENNEPILYEIYRSKTSIKANVDNPKKIHFTIEVNSEGAIAESLAENNFFSEDQVAEVEEKIENLIKGYVMVAIQKCQEEFNSDVFKFGDFLRENYPDLWTDIKYDWESGKNYFSKSTFEVNAKVIIRTPGAINKILEKGGE